MAKFAWFTGEGGAAYLIEAKDYDEAYAKAIEQRVKWGNEDVDDAKEWFGRNDDLRPIVGEID